MATAEWFPSNSLNGKVLSSRDSILLRELYVCWQVNPGTLLPPIASETRKHPRVPVVYEGERFFARMDRLGLRGDTPGQSAKRCNRK